MIQPQICDSCLRQFMLTLDTEAVRTDPLARVNSFCPHNRACITAATKFGIIFDIGVFRARSRAEAQARIEAAVSDCVIAEAAQVLLSPSL